MLRPQNREKNVSTATSENIEKTQLTRTAAAFQHTAVFTISWPFWDRFATDVAAVKVFAACAVLASILLPLDALWRRSWLSWTPFWLLPGSLLATMSAPNPPLWVP